MSKANMLLRPTCKLGQFEAIKCASLPIKVRNASLIGGKANFGHHLKLGRRAFLLLGGSLTVTFLEDANGYLAFADSPPPFVKTASGLLIQDLRQGQGRIPKAGDMIEIEWEGFTTGYQGKRFGNSSKSGVPFEFELGAGQAIPAIEEAVKGMSVGGIRRIEVRGERPELSYPRDRSKRFGNDKVFTYTVGPQPTDLGGQRALDFVLDNPTLQDFNRTLLFDIKLTAVRPK